MKLVFASGNAGKLAEVKSFLEPEIEVLGLPEFAKSLKQEIPAMPETANSYAGNAQIKAEIIYSWSSHPVLADDSGLEVLSLNRQPGVHSARYAGEYCSAADNLEKLLAVLTDIKDRQAELVCYLHFFDGKRTLTSTGRIHGEIAPAVMGVGGFGYDPVFYLRELGLTLAQIKAEKVAFNTHRQQALIVMREKLLLNYTIEGAPKEKD